MENNVTDKDLWQYAMSLLTFLTGVYYKTGKESFSIDTEQLMKNIGTYGRFHLYRPPYISLLS